MPVSGNEESGVIARQSSNCSAGVPIKKRRFPMVRPPSPPSQEPSSLPVENDSVENKRSSPSQESSLLNASGVTSSPGKSDASKNPFLEVKREISADTNVSPVRNNGNLAIAEPQKPTPTFFSGSMDNVDSKEKLMLMEKSTHQKIRGSTELHLAPNNEALAVHLGKQLLSEQQVGRDCKLELSSIPGNVELSLGLKEPLVPPLAVQNSEGSYQMPDDLVPGSLCLSSSKEKGISQCKSGVVNSDNDSTHVRARRSNWDLNTTMDAWEGSVCDAAIPDTVDFDKLNKTDGTQDIKPFINSIGMLRVGVDTGKQILEASDHRSNFPISSLPPIQQYKSDDSLHLSLGTSFCQSTFSGEHSGSSAKVDSGRVVPNPNLSVPSIKVDSGRVVRNPNFLGVLVSTRNMNSVDCRTVKSEPPDENAKHDCVGARGSPRGLLDFSTVKRELVERAIKLSNSSPPKVVENRSIKSEPVQEGNQETYRTTELMSQKSVGKVVRGQDDVFSTIAVALMPQKSCPSGLPPCSELSISGDVSNQSEFSASAKEVHIHMDTPQEACGPGDKVTGGRVSAYVGHESKESNASHDMIHTRRVENSNVDDPETCILKVVDDLPLDSCRNGEGSASDEEKINISADMLEEESYGSDYESDGNHALGVPMNTSDRQYGREDDEYEDGEVREPLVHTASEGPIGELGEAKNVDLGDCDDTNSESTAQDPIDEKDTKMEDHGVIGEDHIKECVDAVLNGRVDEVVDEDGSLQESLTIELAMAGADRKSCTNATQTPGDRSVQKGHDTEMSSDGLTNDDQGTETAVGQVAGENFKGIDTVEKNDSTLPKTEETFLNGKDADKDANSGANRSRIINLPRASNGTSHCKTRSFPDRSLLGAGRERYSDYEGDFHPRRNRDDMYTDGPRKFVRDRFQDLSFRNYRSNYGRGRGRVSGRLDTLRGEWDSDHNFAREIYNGPADYRFPRHKHASAVSDAELECNGYVMAPDGALVGTGRRGGRKPLSDELPSFRHPSSRRLSPGGRDGPATRSIQMLRRIPRNISPSRCTGEDGSDLGGPRHGEKFMRGLSDDTVDPIFTRPQPPYEGPDGQFVRGNRNFSSVQRRGLPRIRSKSPIRSRTRSPGPWSSPRRRSPDGFNGLAELTQRRSPAIYRMERIRSPDRPCFPEEIVARRHGSPPYMVRSNNDLRDMDSGRLHGNPRSVIPNRRSPSDRVLPRSTGRLDILDPRERTDSDEYFGGPMRSGRFHELGGDGSGDDRRKCGERRGLVRPFRPPFNGADGENLRFHLEDVPRPFRFCPEADSEFTERSNLREREFDRRIKNRPVIAPRRMRTIEEPEGNFRHSGQVWQDDAFDDVSQVKRRRF